MQSPISTFNSFVRQQAEVASPQTSLKRVQPFAETENSSPLKLLRPNSGSAFSQTHAGSFREEPTRRIPAPNELIEAKHSALISPEDGNMHDEPMQELHCMDVKTVTGNSIDQSDWLLVQTLNRNVFSLLTQVTQARFCDPAILLNQQLETRYPGITVIEYKQQTGSVIHVYEQHIRVRQDFLTRITAFSDEPSVLIARALLTDCITCKLCELYQNGQIYLAELENMNARSQAYFLENRKAMLEAYRNTAALPMPDQFSTLCVLDDIPL